MSQSGLKDKNKTRPASYLLKVLWSYIREFKKLLVLVIFVIVLYTLAATLQPIVIQLIINELLRDINSQAFGLLIGAFIGLSIFLWIFQSVIVWLMSTISSKLVQNIRDDTFSSLVGADMDYHHKNQSGNITARVVSDSQEVATGLTLFTNTSHLIM